MQFQQLLITEHNMNYFTNQKHKIIFVLTNYMLSSGYFKLPAFMST